MKTGSVSAAASLINVSQPAVTKALQHAELQLGFKLFRRIKGRVYPTPEATVLYREVGRVSSALETVRSLARNLRAGNQGHIRVSATPVLAQEIVPLAIQKFRVDNPGITCAMETNHWKEVFDTVLTNEVDIAFTVAAPEHPAIHRQKLRTGEMALAFPAARVPKRDRLTLRELVKHDYIGLQESVNPVVVNVRQACEQAGLDLKPVIQVQTNHVALWFVSQGAGVAVIDEFTAAKANPESVALRRLSPPPKFDIELIHAKDRPPSVYAERFVKYFIAACDETNTRYESLLRSTD